MNEQLEVTKMDTQVGDNGTVTSKFHLSTGDVIVITVHFLEVKWHLFLNHPNLLEATEDDVSEAMIKVLCKKFADTYNALHGAQS